MGAKPNEMTLDELKIKETKYFTGKPVKRVFVFGSFLEKGDEVNDIDLIAEFDYDEAPKFDLFDHLGYAQGLEDVFGKKVDLLSYTAIKPNFITLFKSQIKPLYGRG